MSKKDYEDEDEGQYVIVGGGPSLTEMVLTGIEWALKCAAFYYIIRVAQRYLEVT